MARSRRKEPTSVGHTTPPLIVTQHDPSEEHPSLGAIRRDRRAKAKAKIEKGKSKIKIEVKVDHGT